MEKTKMKKTITQHIEESGREFDEKFPSEDVSGVKIFSKSNGFSYQPYQTEEIKSFIVSRELSLIEKIVEMCEEGKPQKPYPNANNNYQKELDDEDKIIEQTLSSLQSEIKKLTKDK